MAGRGPLDHPLSRAALLRAGGGLLASLAWGPRTMAQTTHGRMLTRAIPSSGAQLPVIGVGTYRTFDIGGGKAERSACAGGL